MRTNNNTPSSQRALTAQQVMELARRVQLGIYDAQAASLQTEDTMKKARLLEMRDGSWAREAHELAEAELSWRRPHVNYDNLPGKILEQAVIRVRELLGMCAQEIAPGYSKPLGYKGEVIVAVRRDGPEHACLVTLTGRRIRVTMSQARRMAGLGYVNAYKKMMLVPDAHKQYAEIVPSRKSVLAAREAAGDYRQPMIMAKAEREQLLELSRLLSVAWEQGRLKNEPPLLLVDGSWRLSTGSWIDEEESSVVRHSKASIKEMWVGRKISTQSTRLKDRDMSLFFGKDDHAKELGATDRDAVECTWARNIRVSKGSGTMKKTWIISAVHMSNGWRVKLERPGMYIGVGRRAFADHDGAGLRLAMRKLQDALCDLGPSGLPLDWVKPSEGFSDRARGLVAQLGETRVPHRWLEKAPEPKGRVLYAWELQARIDKAMKLIGMDELMHAIRD